MLRVMLGNKYCVFTRGKCNKLEVQLGRFTTTEVGAYVLELGGLRLLGLD